MLGQGLIGRKYQVIKILEWIRRFITSCPLSVDENMHKCLLVILNYSEEVWSALVLGSIILSKLKVTKADISLGRWVSVVDGLSVTCSSWQSYCWLPKTTSTPRGNRSLGITKNIIWGLEAWESNFSGIPTCEQTIPDPGRFREKTFPCSDSQVFDYAP